MWCNWFNRWSTSHLILPHTCVSVCENSWTGSILGPEVCHVFSVERIILFGLRRNPTSQTHVMTHCQLTFIKTHIRAIWNDNFRRSEEFNFLRQSRSILFWLRASFFLTLMSPTRAELFDAVKRVMMVFDRVIMKVNHFLRIAPSSCPNKL